MSDEESQKRSLSVLVTRHSLLVTAFPRHAGLGRQRLQVRDDLMVDRHAEAPAFLLLLVLDLAGSVDPLHAFLAARVTQEAEVAVDLAAELLRRAEAVDPERN